MFYFYIINKRKTKQKPLNSRRESSESALPVINLLVFSINNDLLKMSRWGNDDEGFYVTM